MHLNDLLRGQRIDPEHVLVLRHRPHEPQLRKVLPWFAAEAPEVFNAYQQTQGPRVEKAMQRASHVAAFIGHEPGKALFVGLYAIGATTPLTRDSYLQIPANVTLKTHGSRGGFDKGRSSMLWFDLALTDFYAAWKGKLIISWPGLELAWWRRAHRNEFSVLAILEESAFDEAMPEWNELALTWEDLRVLPTRWKSALSQWRGIYVIFDHDDRKSYVGSAYGKDNLLGRWLDYATVGHGGNKHLRKRNPRSFSFSILQRVSPTWKRTRSFGLKRRGRLVSIRVTQTASMTTDAARSGGTLRERMGAPRRADGRIARSRSPSGPKPASHGASVV